MNRLIIVGNGFDLAHGLPTSYSSFLDYLWSKFDESTTNPIFEGLYEVNFDHFSTSYTSFSAFVEEAKKLDANYRVQEVGIYGESNFAISHKGIKIFRFKNKFFELINVQNAVNWVDIENIYYKILISLVKQDGKYKVITSIKQLNKEFLQVKILLQYYLQNEVEDSFIFDNKIDDCRSITDLFEYQYQALTKLPNSNFFLEFPADFRNELIEFDEKFHPYETNSADNTAYENLFLNFNYTSNVENYVNIINAENKRSLGRAQHIQIHGNFRDATNKLNFGFGDEMDDHYKIIENVDDNNYLENIKSFMYLNNANYKNLLNWIESDDYQVFIMGHSCGLSDRTLLNTIFEHHNCKSIKIFYYQENSDSDDFTKISQNLSRHFNKKALMRSKVVNKELCIPLPQNVRYRKNYFKRPSI